MKHKMIKLALFAVCLIIVALAGGLVYLSLGRNPPSGDNEPAEAQIAAVWFTNSPQESVLTLYEDGTYTSSNWGSPTGSYATNEAVIGFVGDDGASYLAEVSEGVLTLHSGEAVYVYYSSKEAIPPMPTGNAVEELNSVRLHTAKAILEQGEWLGEEGTTFSADEDSIALNGVEMTYRAVSVEAVGGAYELSVEMGGAEQKIRISLVDEETMTYGVEISGYLFTANGTRFLLDS